MFDAIPVSGFSEEDLFGQVVAEGVSALAGAVEITQFTAVVSPVSKLFANTTVTGNVCG